MNAYERKKIKNRELNRERYRRAHPNSRRSISGFEVRGNGKIVRLNTWKELCEYFGYCYSWLKAQLETKTEIYGYEVIKLYEE